MPLIPASPNLGTGPTNQQGPAPQTGSTTPTGQVIGPLPASTMPGQLAQTIPVMANFQFLLDALNTIGTDIDTVTEDVDNFLASFSVSGVDPIVVVNNTVAPVVSIKTMAPSGASHDRGATPDTPAVAGTTKFLREDATWQVPPGGAAVSITATTPIVVTPSPITGTGVVSHATSGVTPGTYGDANNVGQFTVDAYGHLSAAAQVAIASPNLNLTLQSLLGRVKLRWILGINGTVGVQVPGAAWSAPSSFTVQNPDYSTAWLSVEKAIGQSGAGAGSAAEWYLFNKFSALTTTNSLVGGFLFYCRVGWLSVSTTSRCFVGMAPAIIGLPNADPSALINMVGFGADSGDANFSIMCNDGSGTATKTTLGGSFPATTSGTDYYEFILFAAAGQTSQIEYSARQIFTGATANGILTTNIPVANVGLGCHVWLNNDTNATVVKAAIGSIYVQSDY